MGLWNRIKDPEWADRQYRVWSGRINKATRTARRVRKRVHSM